jgi:hypothetical protein
LKFVASTRFPREGAEAVQFSLLALTAFSAFHFMSFSSREIIPERRLGVGGA